MERWPNSPESARFTITHGQAIKDPQARPKYQEERVEAIKAGGEVLIIRGFGGTGEQNFDDNGLVIDLYMLGESIGFIEGTAEAFVEEVSQEGFQIYDYI